MITKTNDKPGNIFEVLKDTQPGYKEEISKNEDRFRAPKCPFCGWEGTYFVMRDEGLESFETDFLRCPDCACPLKAYSHEFNQYALRAQKKFMRGKQK